MKYLFVCKYGINRSPTAVDVMNRIAEERGMNIESDYIGIDRVPPRDFRLPTQNLGTLLKEYPQIKALVKRAEQESSDANKDLDNVTADMVFIMEKGMEEGVRTKLGYDGKIVCLNIPDKYDVDSPELVSVLKERLEKYCFT